MCCSYYLLSFVFELRRCVGIRRCNSNTPIFTSIIFLNNIISIQIGLARPHIGVLVCRYENQSLLSTCFYACVRDPVNLVIPDSISYPSKGKSL